MEDGVVTRRGFARGEKIETLAQDPIALHDDPPKSARPVLSRVGSNRARRLFRPQIRVQASIWPSGLSASRAITVAVRPRTELLLTAARAQASACSPIESR